MKVKIKKEKGKNIPIGEHKVQVLDIWPNDLLMVQFDDGGGMVSKKTMEGRCQRVTKILREVGIQNRLLFLAKDVHLTVIREGAPAANKTLPENPWEKNPWDLIETGPRQVLEKSDELKKLHLEIGRLAACWRVKQPTRTNHGAKYD